MHLPLNPPKKAQLFFLLPLPDVIYADVLHFFVGKGEEFVEKEEEKKKQHLLRNNKEVRGKRRWVNEKVVPSSNFTLRFIRGEREREAFFLAFQLKKRNGWLTHTRGVATLAKSAIFETFWATYNLETFAQLPNYVAKICPTQN